MLRRTKAGRNKIMLESGCLDSAAAPETKPPDQMLARRLFHGSMVAGAGGGGVDHRHRVTVDSPSRAPFRDDPQTGYTAAAGAPAAGTSASGVHQGSGREGPPRRRVASAQRRACSA